jgi:hypothetical protein
MNNTRKQSTKQEKSVAKQINGRITPNSGATDFIKGDVRSDIFLVECKTTDKPFYSLPFSVWGKIYREAVKDGLRIPLMCIDIQGKRCYICESVLCDYLCLLDPTAARMLQNAPTAGQRQFRICGNLEFVVNSTERNKYELAVVPEYEFMNYVLPRIIGETK